MFDVVIIGAGAAGLAAARKLADARASYVVLEAKPHVGGRAVTDTTTFGSAVDLGGHWLHSPAQSPFAPLVERYGFRVNRAAEDFRIARGGQVLDTTESADCFAYIDSCFERIAAAGNERIDCLVADLFPFQGKWHDMFEAAFMAKQGVPARAASAQDFARYVWEGDDLPVLDGFGALVARHAQGLDVRTNTPATRIDWSGSDGVTVETPQGTLQARAALITASTGVLAAEAIRFTPSLPEWKLAAIADLPLGSCNKIILGFDRNVFGGMRDAFLLPDLGPDRSLELLVREDGRDIVTAMYNGPFAKELAAQGAAEGRTFTLDVLAGIFGSTVRDAALDKMVTADWDHDPWVRGCYAAANLGRTEARAVLGRPIENRLFFAGEAIHDRYMGDIHGAHLSGEAAAEAALAAINRS